MSNFCCADIETVPNWDLPKECIPQFDPDSVKLGNLKDKDKVEAKIEEARQEFDKGLVKKMSLDPDLCRVVCVGTGDSTSVLGSVWVDEKMLLEIVWKNITNLYFKHIPLVSFNGIQFDLPVLWHSAIRLGIPVDPQMYRDLTKKYDNRFNFDLMQILSGWDRTRYKSQDFYQRWLGFEGKKDSGSQVYQWWIDKEYEKIKQHCEADVNSLVKIWERLQPYVREDDK